MHRLAVGRTEEVTARGDKAQQSVFRTFDEEAEIDGIVVIRPDDGLEGDRIKLFRFGDGIDARCKAEIAVLVGEAHHLRRREAAMGFERVHRREEIRKDSDQDQQRHQHQPDHAGEGASEAPPDQREIGLVAMGGTVGFCCGGGFGFHHVKRHHLRPSRIRERVGRGRRAAYRR